MKKNGWKYQEALNHVRINRKFVLPNMGFRKKLKKYEYELGYITEEEYKNQIDNAYNSIEDKLKGNFKKN